MLEEACKLSTEREKWTLTLARLAARRVLWVMDNNRRASKFSLVFVFPVTLHPPHPC